MTELEKLQEICQRLSVRFHTPQSALRVVEEMRHMHDDYSPVDNSKAAKKVCQVYFQEKQEKPHPYLIKGKTLLGKCRQAQKLVGDNFLSEALLFAGSYEKADEMRVWRTKMIMRSKPREEFFRVKAPKDVDDKLNNFNQFNLLNLPVELTTQVMEKSNHQDIQNFAASCQFLNNIYQHNTYSMPLPDVALILSLSSGNLVARWITADKFDDPLARDFRFESEKDTRRRSQLFRHATHLRIESVQDFTVSQIKEVEDYVGDKRFRKVVVKGQIYSNTMKEMVEKFDLNSVEIDVERLDNECEPFPEIKTIRIGEPLSEYQAERLMTATHFVNIACVFSEVDSFFQLAQQWDRGEREIERWVIDKPYTSVMQPFGKRYRNATAVKKGHLEYITERSKIISHGELTEFRFVPAE